MQRDAMGLEWNGSKGAGSNGSKGMKRNRKGTIWQGGGRERVGAWGSCAVAVNGFPWGAL